MASDTTLHQLLKQMVEMGASDLHLTTSSPPMVRLDGRLIPLPYPPMTVSETKHLAYSVLTDTQKHRFEESLELDFSFGVRGLARFRANVLSPRGFSHMFATTSGSPRSWKFLTSQGMVRKAAATAPRWLKTLARKRARPRTPNEKSSSRFSSKRCFC